MAPSVSVLTGIGFIWAFCREKLSGCRKAEFHCTHPFKQSLLQQATRYYLIYWVLYKWYGDKFEDNKQVRQEYLPEIAQVGKQYTNYDSTHSMVSQSQQLSITMMMMTMMMMIHLIILPTPVSSLCDNCWYNLVCIYCGACRCLWWTKKGMFVSFVIGQILCSISLETLPDYSPCCRAEISVNCNC